MTLMTAVLGIAGVVMAPIMEEFGWSRSVVTSNILILSTLTFLMAPFSGKIIQRFGLRPFAATCIAIAVPCLILVTQTTAAPASWYGIWVLYGLINLGLGPVVWSTAVATLFDRSRGLALAITLSGSGIAYMIFPPISLAVVHNFGWRGVYVLLAALFLFVQLPLTLLWCKTREDLDNPTGGGEATQGAATKAAPVYPGFTLAEALQRRQFWQLMALSVVVSMVEGAMAVHLFPILSEGGLDGASAAGIAGLMGLSMIAGRLGAGALLDRFDGVKVFASAIGLIVLASLLARTFDGSRLEGIVISVALGVGSGATTNVIAYITSRYFGLKAYASIFGILLGTFALGIGAAPTIASYLRDVMDTYTPMFSGFAIVMAAAVVVTLALGRPPLFETRSSP